MKRRLRRGVDRVLAPKSKRTSKIPLNHQGIVDAIAEAMGGIAEVADDKLADLGEDERAMAVASALIGFGVRLARTTGAERSDIVTLCEFHEVDSRAMERGAVIEADDDEPSN